MLDKHNFDCKKKVKLFSAYDMNSMQLVHMRKHITQV